MEGIFITVPRGMELRADQDLYVVRPVVADDGNHTTWEIDVKRPPQYGSWPTPPEFLGGPPGGRQPRRRAVTAARGAAAAARVPAEGGQITQAEY